MNAKLLTGTVGNIPLRGVNVDVDTGDVTQILTSASGMAKTLFKVGGGLALGGVCLSFMLGAILIQNEEDEKNEEIKKAKEFKKRLREMLMIDVLSMVKTQRQMFYGICASEKIEFTCENYSVSVPTKMVKLIARTEIKDPGYRPNKVNVVTLFDGSSYVVDDNDQILILDFWTVYGLHRIKIDENLYFVQGAMPSDKIELSKNLSAFLSQKGEDIKALIGENGLKKILDECSIDQEKFLLKNQGTEVLQNPALHDS